MNRVNEYICLSEKSQGHRGDRKVKCEISQAFVMMYVKFIVHSTCAKQFIVLNVEDRRADGRSRLMTTIGIPQNFG